MHESLKHRLSGISSNQGISVKPLVHVCTFGPPTTEHQDTNGHRDFNEEDFKIIQDRKPSLV
jgi:hypothetical protein